MKIKRWIVLTLLIAAIVTGCNQKDSTYQTLDEKKLNSENTDINDRADYYDKNVDDRIDKMSPEEKEKFYVDVTVNYISRENVPEDDIIFLRNDNVYEGDLYDGDDTILLPPGIYKLISSEIGGHDADFGEINLLTPGEKVTIIVDYNTFSASRGDDRKWFYFST